MTGQKGWSLHVVLSGRDIKEEAICYSAGPVRQMLLTLPNDPDYTWTMMKVENSEKLF